MSAAVHLRVVPPLVVAAPGNPLGYVGTAYSDTLSVSGGTPTYAWSIAGGALPSGLMLNPKTGLISGNPTKSGIFKAVVRVTDQGLPAQSKTASLTLEIDAAKLSIAPVTLPSAEVGIAYAAAFKATGGTPAYTWSVTSGSLPAGLEMSATTGVIAGAPKASGKATFTVSVKDNSQVEQAQSVVASITAAAPPVSNTAGTTWYVRSDGGTRYSNNNREGQCDGKGDAAYGGVGTNQHCAFSDYRYLYDDQSYSPNAWVISGGDTVILDNTKQWRVGFDQGVSPNDTWCRGGGGPFGCFNPNIPAGTPTQHTRILGRNYATCHVGTTADGTQMTQLFGGYGVFSTLNLTGAQYVDVECIEITRHSQCIRHGYPVYPSGCSSSYPLDDYDSEGITTDTGTHDVLLQDMWIHGHTDRGIIGPIGGVFTALRTTISYNGMAGWDFDDGSGTKLVNGVWNFLYSTIEWNGCNQEYPVTHTYPAISCYGQSSGGYGDGVGSPAGTGFSANVDHSTFRNNTQDGLDLGHVDTGGPYTLNISNSLFYANNGGQFKWGANLTTAVVTNNLVLANCYRMSAPIAGAPSTYNTYLGDFCRAQDAISFNFIHNGTALLANNTIVSYAPTTFDMNCWDNNCGNSVFTFENNIVMGYANPATYNDGGQVGGPGGFYYQASIGSVVRDHNLFYGIRNLQCPTNNAAEACGSPSFVGQPVFQGETSLDNFNFNLMAASPAIGAGTVLSSVTTDFNGSVRPNPPAEGALQ